MAATTSVMSNGGTTFSLSAGVPATFNVAGYAALTYTLIGNVSDGGEHGRAYNPVTFNAIDTRGTQKFKGSFDEGNKTLQIGYNSDDAGMVLLKTALNSDNPYAVKIVYPNLDVDYFQCRVMSVKKQQGSIDNILTVNVELAIITSSTGVGIVEFLST